MNILFITSRPPYPPNRGDKLRTNMFLKIFSREHNVFLFTFYENNQELEYKAVVEEFCQKVWFEKQSKIGSFFKVLCNIFGSRPSQIAYYYKPGAKKKIKNIVIENKIEIIYFHLIRTAYYLPEGIKAHKILDYTDCISREYQRSLKFRPFFSKLFYQEEARRMRKCEKNIWKKFDDNWFITGDDIKSLGLDDYKYFSVIPNPVRICAESKNYSLFNRLVFVGNMSVPHNIQAVEFCVQEIMPEFAGKSRFDIIGANPEKVKKMHGINSTRVLGFVDDLYHELLNSDVFLAPMFYSAGIQNKVLEAMACGLPVLTTQAVADSISATPGKHLLTASDKNDFSRQLYLLLADKNYRQDIGLAGKELITRQYEQSIIETHISEKLDLSALRKKNSG
ncbi:MAG: glycosyltransferase [Candidatus Cloacimonetes bacterium]|nr:glycosyltransferase [Candidatus Cloacimonadota bacterium]